MLDYIKDQLQARMHANDPIQTQNQEEAQMNDAILECAHLIQELDDLSLAGTEAGSSRPFTKIDIPLEDDIEITTVEMDMLDGRVTDVPGDATTMQESDTNYFGMKTPADFYQEAYASTTQFQRESDVQFAQRCEAIAAKKYAAYKNYCIQEGLFGFDKLQVNDSRVPARVTLDIGTMNGHPYSVKLAVKFEVDKKMRILKKQLDSVIAFQNNGVKGMQQAAFSAFGKLVGVDDESKIWDKVTPIELVVPVKPSDKFCVAVGCELDGTGNDTKYIEWHMAIKGSSTPDFTGVKAMNSIISGKDEIMTKGEAIKQEAALIAAGHHAPNRFYQEAIDFGNPDEAPAADENAPAVSFDAPPADGAQQPTADAGAADPNATAPADQNKEVVDTNDVSDQIAEKVADDTQGDANADNDINIDGVDATSDVDASEGTDMPTDDDLNSELGGGGDDENASTVGDESAPASDLDFDNMTMDEMLAQGQEKMKTMTMAQLKEFLQADTGNGDVADSDMPPATDDAATDVQESFQFIIESAKDKGQTVRNRLMNAMEDMQKNLNTMHKAFSKDVTRREIQKLWSAVQTSKSESFGLNIGTGIATTTLSAIAGLLSTIAAETSSSLFAGGITSTSSDTRSGEDFKQSVEFVLTFLKIATKRKKIKETFTSDQLDKLTHYRADIETLIKMTQKAFSMSKSSMDVSMKQLDEHIAKIIDQYDEIKNILSGHATNAAIVEEAFFITRGNVNKELDIHLRKALGILNSSEMEIEQLCEAFKKEGKKLNRIVHKASKMNQVFDDKERERLVKLNNCLTDLMRMMRSDIDTGSIMTVKRMIQAFVAEASGVLQIIEAKSGQPIQEGFFSKLKDKFSKEPKDLEGLCRGLIDMWEVDDTVWNAKELGEFVNEKDPIMFQTFIADWLPESALKCALIVDKCIHEHPAACNQFKELQSKFENFANRFNDLMAAKDDRELTVSEYETLQELKAFIPEMRAITTRFLHDLNPSTSASLVDDYIKSKGVE